MYKLQSIDIPTKVQLSRYGINQTRCTKEITIVTKVIEECFTNKSVPDMPEHIVEDQSYRGNRYTLSLDESKNLHLTFDGVTAKIPIDKTKLQDIEHVALELGLGTSSTDLLLRGTGTSIQHYLAALTTISLRENKLIDGRVSRIQQTTFGERYFNFYTRVVSGSGRVLSTNKNRSWFYEDYDNGKAISKLLVKDSSYQVGNYAMKFKPTDLGNTVISRVVELFQLLNFKEANIVFDPLHHIELPQELVSQIKFTDLVILLKNTIGYKDGKFIIGLNKLDTQTDRVYSVFTSISSDTRTKLGYINYDIQAAMPTISIQLLADWERDEDNPMYPYHQEIVTDRTKFRQKVMDETGKSLKWVKTELSKLDNMTSYNTKSEILSEYCEEGITIRDSVINRIKEQNEQMYNIAYVKAKDVLEKVWDEELNQLKFEPIGEKKESSIFFFIWTQVERQVREAMKTCFKDQDQVLDCHDAVYSKKEVTIKELEKAVLDQTGFEVKISH